MNTRLSVAVAFIFKKLLLARIGWLLPWPESNQWTF